ncbi:Coiled-coil domain-containing protein 158, partial [Chlamydotis macqueenii]
SILSTVMENSASSSTGGSPLSSVFCSKYEIHSESEKKNMGAAGKEHMETILEEYWQKGRDEQKRLNETTELHEQQKIGLRLIVADLQTKLKKVQLERDALQDTRQKESQSQEIVKIQLKNTIQELEAANQLKEEMLRAADSQAERLKKMVHSHEEVLLELRGILMGYEETTGKKLCEHENFTTLHIHNMSTAFADVLRDLEYEVSYLKEKVFLVEEELESLKKDSQTQNQLLLQQCQNRIEQVGSEHEQEVAALTDKANSARSNTNGIHSQMEIIQNVFYYKQTRYQNAVHAHQVSHLESTVSQLRSELQEAKRMYEDKVGYLEKQLQLARSEIEARTEQDQRSQESGKLNDQIHQLLVKTKGKFCHHFACRDPPRLLTADLPSQDVTLPFTSLGGESIFSAAPHYTSSPKKVSQEERYRERSPVHLLLTSPPDDLAAGRSASPEHRPSAREAGTPDSAAAVPQITSQPMEMSETTPRRLQKKMESLQNLVESLQIKNQAMSSIIRTPGVKTEKAKEKEKKLAK